MVEQERDEVEVIIQRIGMLAEQVLTRKENDRSQSETALASCIKYMQYYMIRNPHDNAPLSGPELDEYETHDFKVGRMNADAEIQALDKAGILPKLDT